MTMLSRLTLAALLMSLVLRASLAATEALPPQTVAVLAVRADLNEAIGIAGLYRHRDPRVVKRPDGAYEVLTGPFSIDKLEAFKSFFAATSAKRGDSDYTPPLPDDVSLSTTDDGYDTAWRSKPGGDILFFNGNDPVEIARDGLSVSISVQPPASRVAISVCARTAWR